jgi:hypothetical protein
MTASPKLWAAYQSIERALVSKGVPATSPFWMNVAERFYLHPTATRLIARVGRGGAKSWFSRRTALVEMVAGEWAVPAGERHWIFHVTGRLDEGRQGLAQIAEWLGLLGIGFQRSGDQVTLDDLPVGYWALPCTIRGVKGPRGVGVREDECASWSIEGVNPAEEIDISCAAMCITHSEARTMLLSSPMSTIDYHARAFDEGDTEHQIVVSAESWIANPGGITREAAWKASRGDQRVFDREYRAIPDAAEALAFDPAMVQASVGRPVLTEYGSAAPALCLDPNSGGRDSFGAGVLSWLHHRGYGDPWLHKFSDEGMEIITHERDPAKLIPRPSLLCVIDLLEIEGGTFGRVLLSDILGTVARFAAPWRLRKAYSDQRERSGVESELFRHGISFQELVWTNANKVDAVAALSRIIREDRLAIPATPLGKKLVTQLCEYRRRYLPSGAIRFEGKGSSHDDLASVLITFVLASQEGLIAGSPIKSGTPATMADISGAGAGWGDPNGGGGGGFQSYGGDWGTG